MPAMTGGDDLAEDHGHRQVAFPIDETASARHRADAMSDGFTMRYPTVAVTVAPTRAS
jgi:hypothetical protein